MFVLSDKLKRVKSGYHIQRVSYYICQCCMYITVRSQVLINALINVRPQGAMQLVGIVCNSCWMHAGGAAQYHQIFDCISFRKIVLNENLVLRF